MEKNNRFIIILCIVGAIVCIGAGFTAGFLITKNTGDSSGVGDYLTRERELLERIGEYESRERSRIAREAERIESERDRIERTKTQLGTLRQLDRRSSNLFTELESEINILADFFRMSSSIVDDNYNTLVSDQIGMEADNEIN